VELMAFRSPGTKPQGSDSKRVPVDELARSLRFGLRHQVSDLSVSAGSEELTVTGRSRTYYGKQLVTHAVRAAVPGVALRNEVIVG
jgi:hypothetical protein